MSLEEGHLSSENSEFTRAVYPMSLLLRVVKKTRTETLALNSGGRARDEKTEKIC